MTRRIRAAVLTVSGGLALEEIDLPEPGPADVVVEVAACGVCATNLHGWASSPAGPSGLPGAHGHEVAGIVSEVGAGVRGVAPGTRVCLEPALACGCGACDACRGGGALGCRSQSLLPVWGFAEAMVVPERGVVELPDEVDLERATLAEPLASAVHGIRHSATAERSNGRIDGVRVAVLGAGPLGLLTAAAARALGAAEVTVVARHPHQGRAAAMLGADRVLSSDAPGLARTLRRLRPALVVEAAGGPATTLEQAFAAVDGGGEVVVLGLFDGPRALDVNTAVIRNVRAFFAAAYASRDGVSDFDLALTLLGRVPELARLVTDRYPLGEIEAARRAAADRLGERLRVVVTP